MNPPLITLQVAIPLGILFTLLSAWVSKQRLQHRVSLGEGTAEHKGLRRAIRAHGNFSEFVPMQLLLLLIAEQGGLASDALYFWGAMIVVGRTIHSAGIISRIPIMRKARQLGALINYIVLAGLSFKLITLL